MKYFGYYYIFIPILFSFVFFSCSDFGDSEIKGCTNPDACNYNSDAMDDDGSCEVPTACDTCVDNVVVTNGALDICDTCVDNAIIDNDADNDTVCDEDESTGCTDITACNFNANATDDDGSCEVPTACDTCADNVVVANGALDICDTCVNDAIVSIDQDDCGECGGDNSSCVNYSSEIQPILSSNCIGCHPNSGGLSLSSYADLMEGGNSGAIIISGDHINSYLWQRVNDGSMPPGSDPDLSTEQVNLIKQWINEGAQDN
jgi:hypothetical protein